MKFNKSTKISTSFRNINIAFFALVFIFMIVIMLIVLGRISNTVSRDYAELYSSRMQGSLNTYFNSEISLVRKAAHSNAIINWMDDEEDPYKTLRAYEEMMATIKALESSNLYVGIERTLHELSVDESSTIEDISAFGQMTPGYFDDAWYFECTASDREYLLNVDVDKIRHRTLVWLNYKVTRDDKIYGVLCTGLEFSSLITRLFEEYESDSVRTLVIDEEGAIQMDSAIDIFMNYQIEDVDLVSDHFAGTVIDSMITEYLGNINDYFTQLSPTVVVENPGKGFAFATIAPITGTTWSVVTLFDSSQLFSMTEFIPLIAVILVLFALYIIVINFVSKRYVFEPFQQLYDKTNEQNNTILDNINYASKIQKNLLPKNDTLEAAFSDHSIIWKPRDVVGGDIFWLKNFDRGSVLCVCDCTGHGTSGALLTTLVVSALEAVVWPSNCHDTANIVWQVEQRLAAVLHVDRNNENKHGIMDINDGCDIAVLFVANDKSVTISAGNINVFVCDGMEVTRHKGQPIFIGEGKLASADNINAIKIPANPDNKFYIASDGMCDQIGGSRGMQFGYKIFKKIILENHNEKQDIISGKIWTAFEEYRGNEPRRDDFELITFKP